MNERKTALAAGPEAKSDFERTLAEHSLDVRRTAVSTLQINTGKLCNQACAHCHVEAGPLRRELMQKRTIDRVLELLERSPTVLEVDITGGAPELNEHFRYLVQASRRYGKSVIDRCNLTVLFEPGQEDTAEFLAAQRVRIVASLPCYLEDNVDAQRGRGVFEKSLAALRRLNALGYGRPGSGLDLNLVYNPVGAGLPPPQSALEAAYRERLGDEHGIVFNELLVMTNMPIKRFARALEREGKAESYRRLLAENFNPAAAARVMCTSLVSVGWEGTLHDCDFNQMLEIPLAGCRAKTIWDIDSFEEVGGDIAFADHCFGCTAGAGSSCGGVLTSKTGEQS